MHYTALLQYGNVADQLFDLRVGLDDQVEWWLSILDAAEAQGDADLQEMAKGILANANLKYLRFDREKAIKLATRIKLRTDDEFDSEELLPPAEWIDPIIRSPLKDHAGRVNALIIECAKRLRSNQPFEAQAAYDELVCLVEAVATPGSRQEADCFHAIGFGLYMCGQKEWALKSYQRCAALAAPQGGPYSREYHIVVLKKIAGCKADLGDAEGVRETLTKALQRVPDGREDLRGEILVKMVELFLFLGRKEEALIFAEAAMPVLKALESPTLEILRRVMKDLEGGAHSMKDLARRLS